MILRTQTSGFAVLAMLVALSSGCQQDAANQSANGTVVDQEGAGPINLPLIPGATVENLKATLGPEYVVQSEGSTVSLVKSVPPHDVMIFVNRDPAGGITSLKAHVVGPRGSGDKIGELYRQMVMTLAKGLGVGSLDQFGAYADIGMIKTRDGFPHDFRLGGIYFVMAPDTALLEQSPRIPFKPDHVKRDFAASPKIGVAPVRKPIPGASLAQVEELLDGFTATTRAGRDQVLYARDSDTHTDYVLCELDANQELVRLDIFAGNVKGDADRAELNHQLWIKLAGLKYDNCDQDRVIKFIEGPKLNYAAPDVRNINGVAFELPLNIDGQRKLLSIYEHP